MRAAETALRARQRLDARFRAAGNVARHLAVPAKGWIKAIRQGLGMSAAQLGSRMGVHQSTVAKIEAAEARGVIQLSSLRRTAEAMNCTLVYALIPNSSLEAFLQKQARLVATEQLKPVVHTMRLEGQSVLPRDAKAQLDDYIRTKLDPRTVWDKLK
jgi:predicted DNA-binding mobile mystery protein A